MPYGSNLTPGEISSWEDQTESVHEDYPFKQDYTVNMTGALVPELTDDLLDFNWDPYMAHPNQHFNPDIPSEINPLLEDANPDFQGFPFIDWVEGGDDYPG